MKRILGLILVSMMLMTMILPVSAEGALDEVTRGAILTVPSSDATLLDNLNLDFPGVTFTSSDSAVINPETGVVTRPEQTKTVILTAAAGSETKDFAFRVPGKYEEVGIGKAIPQSVQAIWSSDFSGTTVDTTHVNLGTSGNVSQNDKLSFIGGGAASFIYPAGEGKSLSGKFVVEYTLKRETASMPFKLYFFGSSGRYLEYGSGGGAVTIEGSETVNITAWHDLGGYHQLDDGFVKTTIYFDTVAGTYEIWLNNIHAQSGSTQGATDLSSIHIQSNAAWTEASVSIDDFKAYYTEIETGVVRYEDHFDDNVLAANIEKTATSAATMESNGYLDVAGTATGGASGSIIHLRDDHLGVGGKFIVEFKVTRNEYSAWPAAMKQFQFNDVNGNKALHIKWGQNRNIYINHTDSSTEPNFPYGSASVTAMVVKLSVDADKKQFSCWIDGTKLDFNGSDTVSFLSSAGNNLAALSTVSWGGDCKMDYIKVYEDNGLVPVTTECFEGTSSSLIQSANNLSLQNGAFAPTNSSATSSGSVSLLPLENGNLVNLSGKFIVECTVERSVTAATTDIGFYDAAGKQATLIRWWNSSQNNGNSIMYHNGEQSTNYYQTWSSISGSNRKMLIKILFDTSDSSFKLWINNVEIDPGVNKMYTSGEATSIATISLSNTYLATDAKLLNVYAYAIVETETVRPEVSALALDYNPTDNKVTILSPAAEDLTVIAAAYAGSGADKTLISAVSADVTLAEDGSVVADTSKLSVKGADSVIIYLWSDMDGLQPLYAVYPVSGIISAN